MQTKTKKTTFVHRTKSMLKTDAIRLSVSPLLYIMLGIAFVVPVLILVMTTMMDGSVTTDPNGNQTVVQGFDNVWQIIGSVAGASAEGAGGMDMLAMCNIDMMFFAVGILVCLFVSEDFKSGYVKNLFTVRAKKTDYVLSKTIIGFLCSIGIFIAFFLGTLVGGGVAGLPFVMEGFNAGNLVCCLLSKMALSPVFLSIDLLMSVIGKQKTCLSICLSLAAGMLLFMMISALTPLNATVVNVLACLIGGTVFAVGLGAVSNAVLNKTSLL